MPGEALTLWTVRTALAFAFAAAMLLIVNRLRDRSSRWPLILWTLGCWAFLAHVAAAFHFYHQWLHSLAVAHTAEQTAAFIGWRFGGGIYFNYAFAACWIMDLSLLWRQALLDDTNEVSINSASPVRIAWFIFFLFMVVNGAIVFASGPVRWISAIALLILAIGWLVVRTRQTKNCERPERRPH